MNTLTGELMNTLAAELKAAHALEIAALQARIRSLERENRLLCRRNTKLQGQIVTAQARATNSLADERALGAPASCRPSNVTLT